MDDELAALIEEQTRQEQMLRSLGLLDDEEPQTQVAEIGHESKSDEAIVSKQRSVPIALSIGAKDQGKAARTAKPLLSPKGREFLDHDTRIFATASQQWLASIDAFRQRHGRNDDLDTVLAKVDDLAAVALRTEAASLAADLLDIAVTKREWASWTMTATPEFLPVLAAAFYQAISQGLPLVPNFGQPSQSRIYIATVRELHKNGAIDSERVRTLTRQALDISDERRRG